MALFYINVTFSSCELLFVSLTSSKLMKPAFVVLLTHCKTQQGQETL